MTNLTDVGPFREANRITKFWREHGPNEYPIDFSLVVKHIINPALDGEELVLKEDSFASFDGMCLRVNSKKWVAFVNSDIQSRGRRNFTAAHEIFHFLGHRKIAEVFECGRGDLFDYESDKLEVEANQFASQILLPPDKLRPCLRNDFCYESVKALADELGASVTAVAYKWLQLSSKKIAFFESRDGFVRRGYSSEAAFNRGIFFKQSCELPESSLTHRVHSGANRSEEEFDFGVWHPKLGGREFVHKTTFEDFTYTFLTFSD